MMLLVGLRGVLSCLAHCCGPAMAQSRVAHGSKAAAVTALQKQAMESESTREQSQGLKDLGDRDILLSNTLCQFLPIHIYVFFLLVWKENTL